MAQEIERKFIVNGTTWKAGARSVRLRQGYLSSHKDRTVRVRTEGDRAVLTVKGPTSNASRLEFEYAIPVVDAMEMLDALCERPLIDKTRWYVPAGDRLTWEIDEFHGDNDGLVVAEIELASPEQAFAKPPWLGRDVSDDPRYFNANLVSRPFSTWSAEERQR